MKVKMNVQTTFKGNVLKKGEEYDVNKAVALRWHERNIATILEEPNDEGDDNRLDDLGIQHTGSGWYELPNGEKVQGKDKAIDAAEAFLAQENDEDDDSDEDEVTEDES